MCEKVMPLILFLTKKTKKSTSLFLTWYNLRLDQPYVQTVLDSNNGKTAGRRRSRTATSTFLHWQTSRRPAAAPRTPEDTRCQYIGRLTTAEHPLTFIPSSQEIQRSPRVRKQATACRAKWWIQPSSLSWVMMASIHGKPVWPFKKISEKLIDVKLKKNMLFTFAHLAKASGFLSQGICTQIGFPDILSKFGFLVAAQ